MNSPLWMLLVERSNRIPLDVWSLTVRCHVSWSFSSRLNKLRHYREVFWGIESIKISVKDSEIGYSAVISYETHWYWVLVNLLILNKNILFPLFSKFVRHVYIIFLRTFSLTFWPKTIRWYFTMVFRNQFWLIKFRNIPIKNKSSKIIIFVRCFSFFTAFLNYLKRFSWVWHIFVLSPDKIYPQSTL